MHLIIYSDGGARGNPGPAGAGAVIINAESNQELARISQYLGNMTNNQAEYLALIYALEKAVKLKPAKLTCYLDSELVVKQLGGLYKVKKPHLKDLFHQANQLIGTIPTSFKHIPRDKNKLADSLVNKAIDQKKT